jgi:predicted deacetylase
MAPRAESVPGAGDSIGAAQGGRVSGTLAVAIHDVEPATYERCALIRDWLDDHGVDRVTLLVIPAPDLHPFFQRRPELAAWLLDCRDRGRRDRPARPAPPPRPPAGAAAPPAGRLARRLRRRVPRPRRVRDRGVGRGRPAHARPRGLEPRGFVAPGYAYTPALRAALAQSFDWWATLLGLWRPDARRSVSPALCLGTSSRLKLALSPLIVRAGAATAGRSLRLDLHPADFQHPGHVLALEAVLRNSRGRRAVTYDELC